jgi:hypothetical protein
MSNHTKEVYIMEFELDEYKLGITAKPKQSNIAVYGEVSDKLSEMRQYNISVNKVVAKFIETELYAKFEQAIADGKIKRKE